MTLSQFIPRFWADVQERLVQQHRIASPQARHGIAVYRRRVGNVALNQGPTQTADAIASAIKEGRFKSSRGDRHSAPTRREK